MARLFSDTNYLDLGNVLSIASNSVTCAAWVRPSATNRVNNIMGRSDPTNVFITQYQLLLANGGAARWRTTGDQSSTYDELTSSGTLSANTWAHVGATLNGTGAGSTKIYINGTNDGSGAANRTVPPGTFSTFFVGFGYSGSQFGFAGLICEAAVWNTPLVAADFAILAKGISPLVIKRSNLLAYWPIFGVGSPEPDMTGNKINAPLTASAPVQGNHAPVPRWPK